MTVLAASQRAVSNVHCFAYVAVGPRVHVEQLALVVAIVFELALALAERWVSFSRFALASESTNAFFASASLLRRPPMGSSQRCFIRFRGYLCEVLPVGREEDA